MLEGTGCGWSVDPVVHVKEPDADLPISTTDEWLLYMQPKYLMPLDDFYVPKDFRFDLSGASLAQLEEVLLDGYDDYSDLVRDDDEVRRFLLGVIAYLGESLLRVAGGWWTADDPAEDLPGSNLRLHFDPALALEPLSPADLVFEAVSQHSGEVFSGYHATLSEAVQQHTREHPGWEPTKHLTGGVITCIRHRRGSWTGGWPNAIARSPPGPPPTPTRAAGTSLQSR